MLRASLALIASIFTAVQAFAIYLQGRTLCFNEGCAVVDALTTVSPLYFNLAGFLFFQVVFWCLLWGRDGSEHWDKLGRLLLLAGLCAEAVLVFFQYKIATIFCSYCVVILSFIVLLNILSGSRQVFRGIVLFSAVTIASFSLQFGHDTGSGASLEQGTIAFLDGKRQDSTRYLFFSSTCPHCEKVIDFLREENLCAIRFNPLDRMTTFNFPDVTYNSEYQPEINLHFMKSLDIAEVPILVARSEQKTIILHGEQQIIDYLRENCREKTAIDYGGTSSMGTSAYIANPQEPKGAEDACSVENDCNTVPGEASGKK